MLNRSSVPAKFGMVLVIIAVVITGIIVMGNVVSGYQSSEQRTRVAARRLERADRLEQQRQKRMEERRQSKELNRQHAERVAREDAEHERTREAFAKALALTPQPKRRPRKRFIWESPADARARAWNVPDSDYEDAEATALLRIFINEADGEELDSHGIWQVLRTIRSGSCDRSSRRRITDCEQVQRGNKLVWRETLLSAMKRMSRWVVVENLQPRNSRQVWTSKVTLDCSRPIGFPGNEKQWRFQYGTRCPRRAELAKNLVSGEESVDLVGGVRLIAWGGRCRPGQACDNVHACRRGLAMVETDTHNAFWCRPGTRGCSDDIDPICRQYLRLPEGQQHPALVEPAETAETEADIEADELEQRRGG